MKKSGAKERSRDYFDRHRKSKMARGGYWAHDYRYALKAIESINPSSLIEVIYVLFVPEILDGRDEHIERYAVGRIGQAGSAEKRYCESRYFVVGKALCEFDARQQALLAAHYHYHGAVGAVRGLREMSGKAVTRHIKMLVFYCFIFAAHTTHAPYDLLPMVQYKVYRLRVQIVPLLLTFLGMLALRFE